MRVVWAKSALADYHSQTEKNKKKIRDLIENIKQTPHTGLGKPEPLKHDLSGWWSRRITQTHRLVYRVSADTIEVLQCRYHYTK